MAKKILLVEDDPGISLSLRDEFESEGYEVLTAGDGKTALDRAKREKPDLVVLDLMLPVLNGTEVCKRLRADGETVPILMLTVKDKEVDKVLGLELGADDYMTKPFSLRELTARVHALLRRAENHPRELSGYKFGEIVLDFKKYEASKQGRPFDLTPLEFQMMKLLIQKKGQVLTRDDFLDAIWGEDNVSVTFRTVDSHIANIRRKIEDDPSHPRHIKSLRGVGYKFSD